MKCAKALRFKANIVPFQNHMHFSHRKSIINYQSIITIQFSVTEDPLMGITKNCLPKLGTFQMCLFQNPFPRLLNDWLEKSLKLYVKNLLHITQPQATQMYSDGVSPVFYLLEDQKYFFPPNYISG